MKKTVVALASAFIAVAVHAASIDWKYTGSASDEGYQVMLFTTAVADKYDTYSDLVANALVSKSVTAVSGRSGTTYTVAKSELNDASITKDSTLYYVIVSDSSATTFKYGSVSASAYAYDAANQETSPGSLNLTSASFASSGTIGGGDVPEPTTGLLVLLGIAGLSLKRKLA